MVQPVTACCAVVLLRTVMLIVQRLGDKTGFLLTITDPVECALTQRCFLLIVIRLVDAIPPCLVSYSNTLWSLLLQLQEGPAFLTLVRTNRLNRDGLSQLWANPQSKQLAGVAQALPPIAC
jgi:hypothetical protein